jgi:murein DD-endopeptidase MepM/ murein hydrolase activator NlpD
LKFAALAQCLLLPVAVYAVSPVPAGKITSLPGWRVDPFGNGVMEYHRGYDIACPVGTPVRPMQSGTVCYAGPRKGYGNLVAVDHGNGYVTLYGHLSRITARLGSKVTTDTVIALSGNTGHSTGPHLHLEYRVWPGAAFAHKDQQIPNERQAEPEET